jgi:hypothetical protein
MSKEMINKERRISDLEKRFRVKSEECERLKVERDRLVNISNDLKAELNGAQRRLDL